MLNAGTILRVIARDVGRLPPVPLADWSGNTSKLAGSTGPRVTIQREDASLLRQTRRHPFTWSRELKRLWLQHRLLSDKNVQNPLKSVGYKARRPVRHPFLSRDHTPGMLSSTTSLESYVMAKGPLVGLEPRERLLCTNIISQGISLRWKCKMWNYRFWKPKSTVNLGTDPPISWSWNG